MYHRPYIRAAVRNEVEENSPRNEEGQFLDANTNQPIEGQYDLGHKYGHEYWREAENAEQEGLSQKEFNDRMNDPDLYQIEDPSENRSHKYEMKDDSEIDQLAGSPGEDSQQSSNEMDEMASLSGGNNSEMNNTSEMDELAGLSNSSVPENSVSSAPSNDHSNGEGETEEYSL